MVVVVVVVDVVVGVEVVEAVVVSKNIFIYFFAADRIELEFCIIYLLKDTRSSHIHNQFDQLLLLLFPVSWLLKMRLLFWELWLKGMESSLLRGL